MNFTGTIEASQVEFFNKLVAKAQKKALELGVEPITVTVGEVRAARRETRNGMEYFISVVDVVVTGGTPKFDGWRLVGVVSPLQTDDGTIYPMVTAVPGERVATAAQQRDALWCDHCQLRRARNVSFIVAHEDGTEKQVGSSCMKDFLGDARMSPTGLISLANTLISLASHGPDVKEEKERSADRSFWSDNFEAVLTITAKVVADIGWVSVAEAKASGKTATKTIVEDALSIAYNVKEIDPNRPEHKYVTFDFTVGRQYREKLMVLLDGVEAPNEYTTALTLMATTNAVNRRGLGIAVSALNYIRKALGETVSRLDECRKVSQWVGTLGKRQEFELTLLDTTVKQGFDGAFALSTYADVSGNLVVMYRHPPEGVAVGDKVKGKCTPTKHAEYRGVKTTVVNRPSIEALTGA